MYVPEYKICIPDCKLQITLYSGVYNYKFQKGEIGILISMGAV